VQWGMSVAFVAREWILTWQSGAISCRATIIRLRVLKCIISIQFRNNFLPVVQFFFV
jgi:hypothetical protein